MIQQFYRHAAIVGKIRYYFFDRNYNQTLRIGLTILCIGLTALSAYLFRTVDAGGSPIPGLIPVLLLAGGAGLMFVYMNLERFGLLIFITTTLLNDGISTGSGTKATFTFVFLYVWLLAWLFKMIVVEKKFSILPTPANLPILFFMIVVVIALIWSGLYVEPRVRFLLESKIAPRIMTAMVLIISPLTFIMYANHIKSIRTLKFIVWWFIGVGVVFAILRLGIGTVPAPLNARGQFPTWVGILALGQVLFNSNLTFRIRAGLVALIIAWFYITMTLGVTWLSGWLPLLLGFTVVVFFYSKKLFTTGLLIGLALFAFSYNGIQENFARENEESGGTRSQAWQRVFDVTGRHFLFGTGPAGYHFYFTVDVGGFFQLAHNNYVDIIGQTGVTGFAIWILLWGSMGFITWRLYRLLPKLSGGFERGLAISLCASYVCTLVTMALGDWVTPFPYTQTLQGIDYTIWAWILPGMTVAFTRIIEAREKAASPTDEAITITQGDAPAVPLLQPGTSI